MKHKFVVLPALLLALLLITGIVLAATATIDWQVVGGGGSRLEQGVYSLDNTLGQPVVGSTSAGDYDLCAGFWCGATAEAEYNIFLPLVLRNT